jgi:outer membrane protein assembly factor BamB
VLRVARTTRSSVVVVVFALILFSAPARGASDFLSLDISWSSRLDSPPLAPPIVDARHVYVALRDGTIRALSLGDGRDAWTIDVPLTTPLAAGDGVLAGATERELIAIDGATGRARWRIPMTDVTVAPALRAGWVVAGAGPDLLAFRAADGSLVWRISLGAALQASATIEGDRVYAPLADGTLAALAIRDGAIVWRTKLPAAPGAVTAVADRLYLGAADNFFYALDAADGDRDWRWRTSASVLAPVAFDESRVYYTALDNVIRSLDAGSGVQKWRYAMETRPLAGPVLDDDVLVVAGASDLRAVRAADGSLVGKWGAPAELASAPVFAPRASDSGRTRMVIVTGAATGDWRVYGLGPSPEPRPLPLKEIPGRPLSPEDLRALPEPPPPAARPLP